jgi:hypothetical protein
VTSYHWTSEFATEASTVAATDESLAGRVMVWRSEDEPGLPAGRSEIRALERTAPRNSLPAFRLI